MQEPKLVEIVVAIGRSIQRSETLTWNPVTGAPIEIVRRQYKPGQKLMVREDGAKRLMDSGHAVDPNKPLLPRRTLYAA